MKTNPSAFKAVVYLLGATLVLCVVSIALLAGLEKTIPGVLENVTVGALTGLAGLLARTPTEDTVVNNTTDPVPVEVP